MSEALDGELLELAVSTARAAGDLIREGRRGTVEVADTKSSPTDVVTANDLASEQLIRSRILDARPDDGFLGEESAGITGSSGVRWIADPIDGTVNYLYGLPQYAVSIAAERDGVVVAAVVLAPTSGELFTARRGSGAWLDGEPIGVSTVTQVGQALTGTGYHYRSDVRAHQATELARLVSRVRDVRRFGSASLDLCWVASGRLDAYVERGLRPWDLAAAELVVEEAGGRVAGLHGEAAGELITVASSATLFDGFEACLLDCGFGDWPMSEWPPAR